MAAIALLAGGAARGADDEAEFFEKRIRPVLAENCHQCHGPQKQKGGLRLDSGAAILRGGDSGAAVVPGKPEESRIVRAVRYDDPDLQMPPKGRLPEEKIANLIRWIEMGAPWPESGAPAGAEEPAAPGGGTIDFAAARAKHWAWRPIAVMEPPAVARGDWARTPIDKFILAKLEANGLAPAPPADRATLLRRASFDLIGLPPSPEEVLAFFADDAPDAFEKAVDRLLASPRFGERWARHWLDLVRYAESYGHEQDFPINHAWQYRDYVIRALNADVPYDQFVTEHIAGDLLENPRRNPEAGFNESILATAVWHLGQQTHAPVDALQDQADRIDNMIDVFGKAFLGVTVACARCHDHKFDPIPTKDYYALFGILKSSRRQVAGLDPGGKIAALAREARELHIEANAAMANAMRERAGKAAEQIAAEMLAARDAILEEGEGECAARARRIAGERGLDGERVTRWLAAMEDPAAQEDSHPLNAWVRLAFGVDEQFAARYREWVREKEKEKEKEKALCADFEGNDFGEWVATGEAFGEGPTHEAAWASDILGEGAFVPAGVVHSGLIANELTGVLRSPTFTIETNNVHYRIAGENAQVRLVIDNFQIREHHDLLFEGALFNVNTGGKFIWHNQTKAISKYKGHRAYIEIIDDNHGWVAVDEIWFSDGEPPPEPPAGISAALAEPEMLGFGASVEALAGAYGRALQAEMTGWSKQGARRSEALRWALANGLIDYGDRGGRIAEIAAKINDLTAGIPEPMRAVATADGTGEDERIYIRGGHKNLGETAPRQFLEILEGEGQAPIASPGSGRLELARRLLDPADPLPARVAVNRVWHHLFGRGIVGSVDNFGAMGEAPTHPELLDFLADEFRRDGWSIKRLIRRIMLSSAYQMSSDAVGKDAEEKDPANALLHRARLKRLEGEAIRDAALAVSGRLDPKMFGPPQTFELTPFMEGRNPPPKGPLDGAGRRSIYLQVRRNFLPPFMLTFDFPLPDTTIGRRTVSNVPAQALAMMNDPLVIEQARLWARGLLREEGPLGSRERIERAFFAALSRPPSDQEIQTSIDFLARQAVAYRLWPEVAEKNERIWADLCHAIFMMKEFIFVG